jgi:hypothetical protein
MLKIQNSNYKILDWTIFWSTCRVWSLDHKRNFSIIIQRSYDLVPAPIPTSILWLRDSMWKVNQLIHIFCGSSSSKIMRFPKTQNRSKVLKICNKYFRKKVRSSVLYLGGYSKAIWYSKLYVSKLGILF